jgi:thiamine pyrophosphokinase
VFAVLQNPGLRQCTIQALWDNSILHLIHGPASVTITGKQGSNVGLIAAGGAASGITTSGLKWALSNESLAPHSSRGISNQLIEESAVISLQAGSLFFVQSSALSN